MAPVRPDPAPILEQLDILVIGRVERLDLPAKRKGVSLESGSPDMGRIPKGPPRDRGATDGGSLQSLWKLLSECPPRDPVDHPDEAGHREAGR